MSKQASVVRGHLGSQESKEVVAKVKVAGVGTEASLTLDPQFGEQAHMWLRFKSEDTRIHEYMCGQGWHFSAKNRMGYHRVADAQAERMAADLGFPGYAKAASTAAPKANQGKGNSGKGKGGGQVQEAAKPQADAPKTEPVKVDESRPYKSLGASELILAIAQMSHELHLRQQAHEAKKASK